MTTPETLSPRVQDLRARGRLIAAALALPLLVAGTVSIVKRFSAIDRVLAAEGANAVRGVVYELPRGGKLVVPIEPDTDLLRFVVSAYRWGQPLPLTPRHVKIAIHGQGSRMRDEVVEIDLPGIRTHISAEDPKLQIADPLALSFDVHDLGVGEAMLTLEDVLEADGVLVRAYRREHLAPTDAQFRKQVLDPAQKDHLATWAWEPGWNELANVERDSLLATRWRKIGAIRGASGDLRSHPVAFSPPPLKTSPVRVGTHLGNVSVRKEERVAVLLRGGALMRAQSDPGIHLRATIRATDGTETKLAGDGVLEVTVGNGDVHAIEWWSEEEAIVSFGALDAAPVEWLGRTNAYRVQGPTALEIASLDAARAVRVGLRRPLARGGTPIVPVTVRVDLDDAKGKQTARAFRADVARSRVDRYDGDDPRESPTDPATFYVRVPQGGRAAISSVDGAPVDMTLSELDDRAAPEALETRPMDAELPRFRLGGEHTWDGWVPRQPSNIASFARDGQFMLRIGRTIVEKPPPPPAFGPLAPAIAHVKHTVTVFTEKDGQRFDAIDKPFEIDPDAPRPLFVPVVFHAEEPAHVVLELEIDPKHSFRAGLIEHLTRSRSVDVSPGNTRTTFTIGDDLPPGRHRLRVTSTSKRLSVLLPWASTHALGPRWLAGAFEE
jgi:hypothetical protein